MPAPRSKFAPVPMLTFAMAWFRWALRSARTASDANAADAHRPGPRRTRAHPAAGSLAGQAPNAIRHRGNAQQLESWNAPAGHFLAGLDAGRGEPWHGAGRRAARVLHANHAVRTECDAGHPLQLRQGELLVRQAGHQGLLQDALAGARRGRRKLLSSDGAERPVSLAVIPLDSVDGQATLLILGRRQACEPLSVQGFAGCHALDACRDTCAGRAVRRTACARGGAAAWREPGHRALADLQHAHQDRCQVHRPLGAPVLGAATDARQPAHGGLSAGRAALRQGSLHRQCTASA